MNAFARYRTRERKYEAETTNVESMRLKQVCLDCL